MIGLEVMGIRLAAPEDTPVVLLQERTGTRVLPIWISSVDAAAIAICLDEAVQPTRPLTHDLVASLLRIQGADQGRVEITHLHEGIFHARILAGDLDLDARPSDAIAVALRMGWDILCAEAVLDEVGVEVEQADVDEVERFKEFLDTVNPDDFDAENPEN